MNRSPLRIIFAVSICLALAGIWSACSIPNLEKPECTAARQSVKEFYSYHFGNDMKFSTENLALRAKFLTPEFAASLKDKPAADADVFTTGTSDIPKAFRVGGCEVTAADSTRIEVLLFWKDETRSEQKKIYVDAVNRGGTWLVDKISTR
ncbi:MAG: hypothetical protein ABI791_08350 [Acidobacteriota bacterium]